MARRPCTMHPERPARAPSRLLVAKLRGGRQKCLGSKRSRHRLPHRGERPEIDQRLDIAIRVRTDPTYRAKPAACHVPRCHAMHPWLEQPRGATHGAGLHWVCVGFELSSTACWSWPSSVVGRGLGVPYRPHAAGAGAVPQVPTRHPANVCTRSGSSRLALFVFSRPCSMSAYDPRPPRLIRNIVTVSAWRFLL